MVERGQRLHLRAESLKEVRGDGIVDRKNLDGNTPAKKNVFAEEDDCRAAAAQAVENAVRAEDQSGRVPTNHAIALVVREQSGEGERMGRAIARRQTREFIGGLEQKIGDGGKFDEREFEEFLQKGPRRRWEAGDGE